MSPNWIYIYITILMVFLYFFQNYLYSETEFELKEIYQIISLSVGVLSVLGLYYIGQIDGISNSNNSTNLFMNLQKPTLIPTHL